MDWNNKVSDNVRNVPFSGIRKFFDLASTMKDVISLGAVSYTHLIDISEGIVEDIVIVGNEKTKNYVITRELKLKTASGR